MPVVYRSKNLKFCIFTDDHGNPHVHVLGPGAEVKIFLETLEIASNSGFSEVALRRILKRTSELQELLLEAWKDYHG